MGQGRTLLLSTTLVYEIMWTTTGQEIRGGSVWCFYWEECWVFTAPRCQTAGNLMYPEVFVCMFCIFYVWEGQALRGGQLWSRSKSCLMLYEMDGIQPPFFLNVSRSVCWEDEELKPTSHPCGADQNLVSCFSISTTPPSCIAFIQPFLEAYLCHFERFLQGTSFSSLANI